MAFGDAVETLVVGNNTNGWWLPEHIRCYGPVNGVGNSGDGSLLQVYGKEFCLELDRTDYKIKLYTRSGATFVIVSNFEIIPLHDTRKTRSWSIAFDIAGQPVIAYETQGKIYVLQYAGTLQGFVWRGPFAGHDPTLVADAPTHTVMAEGTVWLYHTTLARDNVVKRDAVDQFSIPYITVVDNSIPSPCYVLGAFAVGNQLRVAIGNSNMQNVVDLEEFFPPRPITDTLPTQTEFSNGEVLNWVIEKEIADTALADSIFSDGLDNISVHEKVISDSMLTDVGTTGIENLIIQTFDTLIDQPLVESLFVASAENAVVLVVTPDNDVMLTDGGFTNGSEN